MNTPTLKVDLLIIGGGIHGCGCAREASLRGLSVALCEQDDLASKTSSASTKLIHGGIRYLEQYEFSLVRHALQERDYLSHFATHLVHPLPLVLLSTPETRPDWLVNLGLFMYDHLYPSKTFPSHQTVTREDAPNLFEPLQTQIDRGFLFYEAQTQDARLVIHHALDAKHHGAHFFTHTTFLHALAHQEHWEATLQPRNGDPIVVHAKAMINASGAWVHSVDAACGIPSAHSTTWIEGTHLIVPRWFPMSHGYVLQNPDQRIVFVLPYEEDFVLIGTTESQVHTPLDEVSSSPTEINYLLDTVHRFFNHQLTHTSILKTFSGIRTLIKEAKDPRVMSRDFVYHLTEHPRPYVSIYSGKLTTYRVISEKIIASLAPWYPHLRVKPSVPLMGNLKDPTDFNAYMKDLHQTYTYLPEKLRHRYLRTYGTCSSTILHGVTCLDDLGQHFGDTLYQREVDYLVHEEWATSVEDILWRRTQLGLYLSQAHLDTLHAYLEHLKSLPLI